MDSEALAKLAYFADGMVGPDGETLRDIQTQRTEQEAAREATLKALRERLEAAHRIIQWAEDMMVEGPGGSFVSSDVPSYRLDEAIETWRGLLSQLEDDPNPEALVLKLEQEAEKAKQEVAIMRQRERSHRR